MFTGIVEATGEVVKSEEFRVWIRSAPLAHAEIGASVAVNGVCLTVAEREGDTCRFDLSAETVARSSLGFVKDGDKVNLERPLRLGGELGGHIVQGHVDGVGRVVAIAEDGHLQVEAPIALCRYVVEKGSVTVDGVSLTVTEVEGGVFGIALVPHTLAVTTLGDLRAGDAVNIEVDVLAKYVEKLMQPALPDTETGYL